MAHISLETTFADSIRLNRKKSKNQKVKKTFDLDFKVIYDEENNQKFFIIYDIKVSDSVNFDLRLEYVAAFSTDEAIDQKFKDSDFPIVNAPAIGYPFLRSIVSLITMNAGYGSVILPSINFVNFYKVKQLGKK